MASTSSQNPSSSASLSTPTSWDVFLSFGKDTRQGFTSHLYSALDRYNIRTFMDDPELQCGEVISDALRQAIQDSKIYIAVLSENYASSSWCLDELVEILNCSKTMQRSVIPVFYKIDPSVVRHQTGSFKKDFGKHEDRLVGEMERVQNWRVTLRQVADISGKHIDGTKFEADIVDEIVKEIQLQIKPTALHVAKYSIGLDSRVKDITALLSNGTKGVIKIGIYGMGGIGKTTLSKALFNQLLLGSFKGSCFLENVREISGTLKGLESLQQQLINDVLKSKNKDEVRSVGEGVKLIKDRICSKKILVVIDDLDNQEIFESLVGPFASGSVVIITTRDEETLDNVEVETKYRYKVNELGDAESKTLLFRHAFGDTKPNNTLMILSDDILRLAGGLPLALKVFGSYLYKKSEVRWKSYIERLQQKPNNSIQQRLIISLNVLESDDPLLKKIFLDIACFFIGRNKKEVVEILETYYPYADEKIDILMKKCLLTINDFNEFRMHDLLQEMGKDIARNNSQPGKHSRLWVPKEIRSVLEEHKGTEAIEGIMPHHSEFIAPHWNLTSKLEDPLSFSMEALRRMSKLRFLYFNNINLTGKFERTLEDLRWFRWDRCPLKCLPFDFCPQELVTLELPESKLTTMWEVNMVSNVFENLKTLNMSSSYDLTTTPDFRRLPCLENLILKYCRSLKEIHKSIGSLVSLVTLNLSFCEKLERLPGSICKLRSLEILDITCCEKLKRLPDKLWRLTRLSSLKASYTLLKKLPDIESSQTSLSLRVLKLSGTRITVLPSGISQLSHLKELDFSCCGHLLTVAELPPNLTRIDAYRCRSLQRINVSNFKLLQILDLNNCSVLTEVLGLEELTSLRKISLDGCPSLLAGHFPKTLFQIYSSFEQQVSINLDPKSFPDWIIQSSEEGSTKNYLTKEISDGSSQSNEDEEEEISDGSSQSNEDEDYSSVKLEPNLSHNYLGMILCFQMGDMFDVFDYSVMTSASNILTVPSDQMEEEYRGIVTVPRSIFRVTDTDHTIKFTSSADKYWIHLLYKDENDSTTVNVEDERDNPSASALEVEEGGYPSKRLKLLNLFV